ncbi:Iron-regulated surface determinant protein C precursor [Paenibacillus konkukensis]|uniref:Iron-regulated surface determinant protein C n=1 Tax=Paenibacillus konkukensis TaxID=2020716 RepID=A0ABY4RSL1_9BACL|nr:heme uptake protein IsdC [Paenibacillus konkukensis]UQZ85025.1 Iron-regulated surface determinant protein C precursor [Paenibacillus konkukensis]
MKKWLALPSFLVMLFMAVLLVAPAAQAADLSDGTYTIDYTIKQAQNDSVSMANDYFEKPAKITVKNGEMTMQIQMNHSKWITVFKVPDKDDFVDGKVINSDADNDTRAVEFKVEDISKPLLSKIHVTVKDIDYDHDYTIRFVFDVNSLKNTGAAAAPAPAKTEEKAPEAKVEAKAEAKPEAKPEQAPNAAASQPSAKTSSTDNAAAVSPVKADNPAPAAEAKKQEAAAVSTDTSKAEAPANPKTGDSTPIAGWIGLILVSALFLSYRFIGKKRRA